MTGQTTTDFVILGPAMSSGGKVLDAIHALYFLPENFKLILTGSDTADQSFFAEAQAMAERNGLSHRVNFDGTAADAHAVVLPNLGMSRVPNSVAGDSPEALASAILNVARSS